MLWTSLWWNWICFPCLNVLYDHYALISTKSLDAVEKESSQMGRHHSRCLRPSRIYHLHRPYDHPLSKSLATCYNGNVEADPKRHVWYSEFPFCDDGSTEEEITVQWIRTCGEHCECC